MSFSHTSWLRGTLQVVGTSALMLSLVVSASAGDVRLKLPKKSKPTPVQKLNQEGVRAVEKHDYKKAKKLFYQAYLLDPDDPFTLNNLGYMAELDGEIDRAQRYYSLAADQNSEAIVDRATVASAKGKPVATVAGSAADDEMKVNRLNIYAIGLLGKDRAPEADVALEKALAIDPKNPFTMNNLGYAKEKEGELQQAYKYYSQAANSGSHEPIIVSVHQSWRGKPIDQIAGDNARKVQKLMNKEEDSDAQISRLNLRGVSAINRNEHTTAKDLFQQAYKLDPNNAFTLNNMGYLAEVDGDRETANYFYAKAQEANRSNAKVIAATRKSAEGKKVGEVASSSDALVVQAQEAAIASRRREANTAVGLKNRDGSLAVARPLPEPPERVEPEPQPEQQPTQAAGTQQPGTQQPGQAQQPAAQPPKPTAPAPRPIIDDGAPQGTATPQ